MSVRRVWVIWYAVALHLAWGLLLLVGPSAQFVTQTSFLANGVGRYPLALILFLVAGLAVYGLWRRDSVLWAIPQQVILVLSAYAALRAMQLGAFPDGVRRPHLFIVTDQIPAVLTAVFHTLALLYPARTATRKGT